MRTYAFRLIHGQDLKKEIENYAVIHHIKAGYVACAVGCIYECTLRLADGERLFHDENHYEIVSLMGTLSKDGVHLHLALSDEQGHTIGGHLMTGCLVNTTAEVILHELANFEFSRAFDNTTGYDELVIEQKTSHSE